MQKKELPQGITNPFSDDFLEWWDKWKEFKWTVFKFKYKGVLSEQAKLMYLSEISNGNEETAKEIILRSIGEQWKGLFPLPDNYKKANGSETNKRSLENGSNKKGTSDARIDAIKNW